MPIESIPKRFQGALKVPEDPPDPPSSAQRKSASDEAIIVQIASNTASHVDERLKTPVDKPNLSSPAHPTSPTNPSTPTHPTNPTNPTKPTEATDNTHPTTPANPATPHIHISTMALLSYPSPLHSTPAAPSAGCITRSSSAISDLGAALSRTSEVTHLGPSRSTGGETLSQRSLFVPGAASPTPATPADTSADTRAAATSQPNAIGCSYAKPAKQALPITSAARQRDSSGVQSWSPFEGVQQPPQDTTPISPALATDRGNRLAISAPRDTTPLEISLAIPKCDEQMGGLIRPSKDPEGRTPPQVKPRETAQDILAQLQSLRLNGRGVKPQFRACYNTQNNFLQEGLLVNFEESEGVEEEFRKQVEASGDRVILYQRQFDPRLPIAPTGRVRVLLDLSGSKLMPRVNAFTQQFPGWVNHYVIFKPIQAGAATNSPSRPASTYCNYCRSMEHARLKCPIAPECGGCGSRAHPPARCPGRPKANLPARARAPIQEPPLPLQQPVEPGSNLDGYQLVHRSKRRSLNRPTEATMEVATPPVHAGLSHSDQAPRNTDGVQVVDEHPSPSPPPSSPSSAPFPPPSSPMPQIHPSLLLASSSRLVSGHPSSALS